MHHSIRLITEDLEPWFECKDEGLLVVVGLRVILPRSTGERTEYMISVGLSGSFTSTFPVPDEDQGLSVVI